MYNAKPTWNINKLFLHENIGQKCIEKTGIFENHKMLEYVQCKAKLEYQ